MIWTLNLGDCLDPVSGLASLADKSVDHVITDPPYDEATHTSHRVGDTKAYGARLAQYGRSKSIGFAPLADEDMVSLATQFARVAKRWVLVFCTVEQSSQWRTSLVAAGLQYIRTGAWVKLGSTPQFSGDRPAVGFEAIVIAHPKGRKKWNGGGSHALWTHPIVKVHGGTDRVHTTQKPLPLIRELVELFANEGETVLDPFAGSGTTGIACGQLGRNFIGWEISPEYHAIATRRLRGERAILNDAQPELFGGVL